jgi:hypothetical protein
MDPMLLYLASWLQGFFTWLHVFNGFGFMDSRIIYFASWLQGFFTWLHGFNTKKISLFHCHIIIIMVTSLSLIPHNHHHHCHFEINDNIFSTISPFVIDGNTFFIFQWCMLTLSITMLTLSIALFLSPFDINGKGIIFSYHVTPPVTNSLFISPLTSRIKSFFPSKIS